jgi:pentatricopeptide repeat protein
VRSRRQSDAQSFILRMVRKSGVSRVEIVESLVSVCDNFGSNSLVFDLLIRTYVQARKLREGSEAFRALRSKGFCVSINACNSLLGGLVKVGWVDLAWEVYGEVVRSGIDLNVYTLNIMVNALCKDRKIDNVKLFLLKMEEKGVFQIL